MIINEFTTDCDRLTHISSTFMFVCFFYFRDFFLLISPVFTILFLPDSYALHFLHYFIYVRALYHFESSSDLDNVEHFFDEYYKHLSKMYGPKSQLLTVHLHIHLKDQVIRHGCLSMTSCFPREAYLGLALNLCHGTKYVLEQFTTWYLIDRSLSEVNEIIVDDIFINEKFNDQHLNMNIVQGLKPKFVECLRKQNIYHDEHTSVKYYSRYSRGFKRFQSQAYSRAGKAISHRISFVNEKCCRTKKTCYGEIIFFFNILGNDYAFIRKYLCINETLTSALKTVNVPKEVEERIDKYYGLFNTHQCSYKIILVKDIVNKTIKMRWNRKNVFVFTDIYVDWEHD